MWEVFSYGNLFILSFNLKNKLMSSRLKWAGHVERMGDEHVAEIRCPASGGKKEARKMRLRWKDCVRTDLHRVGGQQQQM